MWTEHLDHSDYIISKINVGSRKSDFTDRYTRRFSPSGMDNDFRNVPRKHPPRYNADRSE